MDALTDDQIKGSVPFFIPSPAVQMCVHKKMTAFQNGRGLFV